MVNSPRLRFFNNFRNNKTSKKQEPDAGTVQGWLLNVHTYRDERRHSSSSETPYLVDADNNCIAIATTTKEGCANSIVSEESVNLDELINNNFTTDMDDETDLPDLAKLELDDSKEDFWSLEKGESFQSFDNGFHDYLKSPELDWSPNEISGPCRSDSFSSDENSLTSHSTIYASGYAKYGMVPLSYPSESASSTSSRSHSRLSSYSATTSHSQHTVIPTPSKSRENKDIAIRPTSPLLLPSSLRKPSIIKQRASHIPSPKKAPTPKKSTSSSLSSSSSKKNNASSTNSIRQSSRPGSPLSLGYKQQSRIAVPKSPTMERRSGIPYKRVSSPKNGIPMSHASGTVKRL
ncbi:hypothetical protein K501DRAFT_329651 [Backusella circina FSU 941]|nr:hypothetical protein K501DRAFT_329651 [Backusella circina FSU 941]